MGAYEDLSKEQLITDLIKLQKRIDELERMKDRHETVREELIRTRSMYQGLFEFAPDAIVVVNPEGEMVQINGQAERLFGYGRNEMINKPVETLMPERFRQGHRQQRQDYFYKPRIRPMGTGLGLCGQRRDGSEFPLDISLGPIEIEKHVFVVSVLRDISLRKQMEEELRRSRDELDVRVRERSSELAARNGELQTKISECQRIEAQLRKSENRLRYLSGELLTTQEKERKRVAQEIHDSIGASLAAVKYKVEDALKPAGDNTPQRHSLESIRSVVQETIEEARRIQMALRPAILDDLGVLATISWFCRQFESTYSSIRIRQEIDIREQDVPDLLKTVIFRVMQEAMNNIAKHSKANFIGVTLRKADQGIQLDIRDNGQGFKVEEILSRSPSSRGLGLDGMRERTELAGGSFGIESGQSGTVIRASWPAESK